MILANAGWRYLDVASLTTSRSYTPITIKLWACLGYTLRKRWSHYNPLHFKSCQVISRQSSDTGVNPPGSQLLLCIDSLSNSMACHGMSKNLAREEYHGTFRVIFDDFLEPGKIWEMARAKSSIRLTSTHDNSRFVYVGIDSEQHRTAPFIVFFDSPTQHFCLWESIWADKLWQLPWCFIVFQTFDSLSMFNSSCCFLGMWVGIPGQSKSAKSGSVSNSSHHWTQQAENIGPSNIVKVTGFLCSAPRSEPIALLCWRLYLNCSAPENGKHRKTNVDNDIRQ